MATAPLKSHQPLHNFSLPSLKWGQRSILTSSSTAAAENPQCRCLSVPPPHQQSDSNSDSGDPIKAPPAKKIEKEVVSEGEGNEGAAAKAWNLRPRRSGNDAAAAVVERGSGGDTKSRRLRGGTMMMERKENSKLWISLSKEEIEEDVYALTGSRPNHRPKKRPRSVQKKLDNLFPGLYMVGFTADTYRVHESIFSALCRSRYDRNNDAVEVFDRYLLDENEIEDRRLRLHYVNALTLALNSINGKRGFSKSGSTSFYL